MAITIDKLDNGNVSFDDGTDKTSYSEVYSLKLSGDIVYVIVESNGTVILALDFNDVTSVNSTAGGLVNTTTADILYTQLLTYVFYKTV